MSRRTERPYKVDGTGKLAPHSAAPCSVPEINGPVVQQEFTSFLREGCNPGSTAPPSGAPLSNEPRAGAGVSRGHSSEVGPSRRPKLDSRGSTAPSLPQTTKPSGGVCAQRVTEQKHGTSSGDLLERILCRENLLQAWHRAKANGGATGVVGMTNPPIPALTRPYCEKIRSPRLLGTYHPQ